MKSRFTPEQWSYIRTRCVTAIFVILFAALIFYFSNVWSFISKVFSLASPFFIGFAIAFLMGPTQRFIEKPLRRFIFKTDKTKTAMRTLSTLLSLAFLFLIVFVFLRVMLPQLIESIRQIVIFIGAFLKKNSAQINQILQRLDFISINGDELTVAWDQIVSQKFIDISQLLGNVLIFSKSVVSSLYTVLVSTVTAFYMLMDKDRLCARIKKICYAALPEEQTGRLIFWTRRANRIFAGFITGKIVDSAIIGVICYFCMLIFRMEYPLLISMVIGVTNVIPFFGPFIGWAPCAIILLIVNPMSALWFSIFILVLQQLDGNVIGPFILGDYVGVSALSIMISIVIGSGLFGFTGMLLAVPVYALAFAIVRTIIENKLKNRDLSIKTADYVHAPETITHYTEESKK